MATAFRIANQRFAATAFDGEGAYQYGGRWNLEGTRMVYAAETRSLACLEILVHADSPSLLRSAYVEIQVDIPDALVEEIPLSTLPPGWLEADEMSQTQILGEKWIQGGKSLGLWVPSAVIPQERNLLINPAHPELIKMRIGKPFKFPFDSRLF